MGLGPMEEVSLRACFASIADGFKKDWRKRSAIG
jgi:hypothetical protein